MAYDYRVRTAYEVDDKASGKIAKMADAAKSAAGHFDSLAMSGLKLGSIMATGAATAAVAALKHGLVNVNATMEETKLGFATTFNMLGNTGIDNGLTLAGDLVEQIRKDAKELPGEFGDFVNMAQLLTAPLLNAGKGIEDIRNTTRQTVVAAAALKVPFEQAAREMAMLIEGHAGGHNLLGNKIGITTHTMIKSAKGGDVEFNKATSEERIAHLNKLLVKGDESLGHFGRSWAGLTSTMVDSMKQFLGRATLPLFERLKGNVASINKLMDSPKFTELADSLGRGLLRAHDGVMVAVSYISEHWDNIKETGREWGEAILGMLKAALPIVEKLGDLLANEMQDPAKLVKELLAARLALGALSNPAVLSGIGSAVMGPGTGAAATEAAAGAGAGAGAAGAVGAGSAPTRIFIPRSSSVCMSVILRAEARHFQDVVEREPLARVPVVALLERLGDLVVGRHAASNSLFEVCGVEEGERDLVVPRPLPEDLGAASKSLRRPREPFLSRPLGQAHDLDVETVAVGSGSACRLPQVGNALEGAVLADDDLGGASGARGLEVARDRGCGARRLGRVQDDVLQRFGLASPADQPRRLILGRELERVDELPDEEGRAHGAEAEGEGGERAVHRSLIIRPSRMTVSPVAFRTPRFRGARSKTRASW